MALPRERQRDKAPGPSPRGGTGAEALARLYWMLAGNLLTGLLAAGIALSHHGLTWRDPAYAVAVASLIVVRFVDITRLRGLTADGDPATVMHWRRYSSILTLICSGAWIAAHGVAFLTET